MEAARWPPVVNTLVRVRTDAAGRASQRPVSSVIVGTERLSDRPTFHPGENEGKGTRRPDRPAALVGRRRTASTVAGRPRGRSGVTGVEVLCVDGDDADRERTVEAVAAAEGLSPTACGSVEAAKRRLEAATVDCLVTAYDLPDGTGLELVAFVREVQPDVGCVLFTDTPFARIDTGEAAHAVVDYLPKEPDAWDDLPELLRTVAAGRTHTAYPLPADEDGRLATLAAYDLDDLSAAAAFDRLTELAARQFDVAVAFVGLVDAHEERFVSCFGADWATMPREDTVCTYAILDEGVTVVEDVAADPRFAANDRLDSLGVRAYAGAPVAPAGGEPIGMFCVLDDEPRAFGAAERESLRLFAAEAADQFELRRRVVAEDGR
jgi:ActR/RegA family two-component response regulator